MNAPSLKLDTPDLARHYEEPSSDRQFKAGNVLAQKLALRPGDKVLDVGSGTGRLAEHVLAREPYSRFPESLAGTAHRVSAAELRGLFEQTGFEAGSIEVVPNVIVHRSGDAAIEFSQASAFGHFLGHLPDDLRRSAREEIRRELEALRTSDGIRLENARILAVAGKHAPEGR